MFDGSDRDRTDGHWSTVCNQDDRVKDGERRWHAIGETHDRFFTLVSFTIRGEPMAGWGEGTAMHWEASKKTVHISGPGKHSISGLQDE